MDLFNLADTQYRTQVFYQSELWVKPRGISMLFITCIGAGGGGGGTTAIGSGIASYGGGGGGNGGICQLMIPAIFVSDTLRISVGVGGAGNSGANGIAGTSSTVDNTNDGLLSTLVCYANAGLGGAVGSNSGTGAGGSNGGASVASAALLMSAGMFYSQPGLAGSSSALGASPTNGLNFGYRTAAGAGGGKDASNVGYSGGTVASGLYSPQITGGASGGFSGGTGFFMLSPLTLTGGAGGGGNGSGTGGVGGDGAIGCGGGGAGAGTSAGTGGRGGNGLVIISCW